MKKQLNLKVRTKCPKCGKEFDILVNNEDYGKFMNGESSIQVIFPYLTADERELLMSGMCAECWDETMIEWDYIEPIFLAYYRTQMNGNYNMITQAEEVAAELDIEINEYKWIQQKYSIMKKHFASEVEKIDKEILNKLSHAN